MTRFCRGTGSFKALYVIMKYYGFGYGKGANLRGVYVELCTRSFQMNISVITYRCDSACFDFDRSCGVSPSVYSILCVRVS